MKRKTKNKIIDWLIFIGYILCILTVIAIVTMPAWSTVILNNGELPFWLAILLK